MLREWKQWERFSKHEELWLHLVGKFLIFNFFQNYKNYFMCISYADKRVIYAKLFVIVKSLLIIWYKLFSLTANFDNTEVLKTIFSWKGVHFIFAVRLKQLLYTIVLSPFMIWHMTFNREKYFLFKQETYTNVDYPNRSFSSKNEL